MQLEDTFLLLVFLSTNGRDQRVCDVEELLWWAETSGYQALSPVRCDLLTVSSHPRHRRLMPPSRLSLILLFVFVAARRAKAAILSFHYKAYR